MQSLTEKIFLKIKSFSKNPNSSAIILIQPSKTHKNKENKEHRNILSKSRCINQLWKTLENKKDLTLSRPNSNIVKTSWNKNGTNSKIFPAQRLTLISSRLNKSRNKSKDPCFYKELKYNLISSSLMIQMPMKHPNIRTKNIKIGKMDPTKMKRASKNSTAKMIYKKIK
jgi:hypothetical protein